MSKTNDIKQAAEDLLVNIENAIQQFHALTGMHVTDLKVSIEHLTDVSKSKSVVEGMTVKLVLEDMKMEVKL